MQIDKKRPNLMPKLAVAILSAAFLSTALSMSTSVGSLRRRHEPQPCRARHARLQPNHPGGRPHRSRLHVRGGAGRSEAWRTGWPGKEADYPWRDRAGTRAPATLTHR